MARDIFVSVFTNAYDRHPRAYPLSLILNKVATSPRLKTLVTAYRSIADKRGKLEFKRTRVPAISVSGSFEGGHGVKNLLRHSGLLQIDMDDVDPNIWKGRIIGDPYTYAAFTSISGSGLKVITKIDPAFHSASFDWFKQYYFAKFSIRIDEKCKDIGRLCFLSYDPNIYINQDSLTYLIDTPPPTASGYESPGSNPPDLEELEHLVLQIENTRYDITRGYQNWLKIGFALANELGEAGREYYHRISRYNPDYLEKATNKQYDECLRSHPVRTTLKSIYFLARNTNKKI